METVIGIKGKDFTLLAADTMLAKAIFFLKFNQTKIRILSNNCIMGWVGKGGDAQKFADGFTGKVALYEIKNGYAMNNKALKHFARHQILVNKANKVKYEVALLMATFDAKIGPDLLYVDTQGATHHINFSGHGLGNTVCNSIFHMMWKPSLTLSEGLDILEKCVREIGNRLVVNLRNFEIFVVDKYGSRKVESTEMMPITSTHIPANLAY